MTGLVEPTTSDYDLNSFQSPDEKYATLSTMILPRRTRTKARKRRGYLLPVGMLLRARLFPALISASPLGILHLAKMRR
jgi:hypothetical protein